MNRLVCPKRIFFYMLALPLLLFILYPSRDYAGGNKTYGANTRAQTMGGAFVAVADDAAAIFYNPAGITQIDNLGIVGDFFPVLPASKYTNSANGVSTWNSRPALGSSTYFAKRINKTVTLGVGVYAPFARQTNYPPSRALFGARMKTLVVDMNLTPVVAFKATEKLSFGAGPTLNYDYLSANAMDNKQKADGWGMSGVLSVLYKFNSMWKAGATYHFPASFNIRGHLRNARTFRSHSTVRFKNPGYLDLGLAIQATDKLLIALGAGVEFWSQAQNVRFFYKNHAFNNVLTLNPKDSYDFHSGLEYRFKPNQALRLGYAFYQQAMPDDSVLPGALDFNSNVFSAGYSYYRDKKWRFDIGYEFAKGKNVHNTRPIYNPFQGTYQGRVSTILVGICYQV